MGASNELNIKKNSLSETVNSHPSANPSPDKSTDSKKLVKQSSADLSNCNTKNEECAESSANIDVNASLGKDKSVKSQKRKLLLITP